ncbi:MAG: HEAT repeat domain-containing protein [Planctomycetota bacterium]|jgi:hypothetical protein
MAVGGRRGTATIRSPVRGDAVPYLIAALDATEKTGIYPTRHVWEPWLVQDAALNVVEQIACRGFSEHTYPYFSKLPAQKKAETRSTIMQWWDQNRHGNAVAWAKAALLSDTDEKKDWFKYRAVQSLYARTGRESFPTLKSAYERLPEGNEEDDWTDWTFSVKQAILYVVLNEPTREERPFLRRVLQDEPQALRLLAARGLWSTGDDVGLKQMLQEMRQNGLGTWGDERRDSHYHNMISFFATCGTPEAKDMVIAALGSRNPYLRKSAIHVVPGLRSARAARSLPQLLDDPFILSGGEVSQSGNEETVSPLWQICDAAAKAFTELAPDAPRFGGKTDAEQKESIGAIRKWWNENRDRLVWNPDLGLLRLKQEAQ